MYLLQGPCKCCQYRVYLDLIGIRALHINQISEWRRHHLSFLSRLMLDMQAPRRLLDFAGWLCQRAWLLSPHPRT